MNTVLEKGNIIAKIRRGEDLNQIIDYTASKTVDALLRAS